MAPAAFAESRVALAGAGPSDARTTATIRLSLVHAQGVEGRAIGSDVVDGVVLLHGLVGSEAERTRALAVTERVEGVEHIRDALRIVPLAEQRDVLLTDALVAGRVSQALAFDADLWEDGVEVHAVSGGVVILDGDVATPERHRRAIDIASQVAGVKSVASLVRSPDPELDAELWEETVSSEAVEAASPFATALSDAWIQTRLKVKLRADPGLSLTSVDIDTREGIVTLFGNVPTQEDKQRALERALDVDGVLLVENELQVVPPSVADTVAEVDASLAREVEARIADENLKGSRIQVNVHNATVRLEGSVSDPGDRMTAIIAAATTRGVRAVSDGLQVDGRSRS
jgi:hyperosmotically inducible protein